jgi:hypothetical protein
MKKFSRLGSFSAICALAIGLGGCMHAADPLAQYVQRSDKNVLSAGDAQSANAAIHIIDPWPKVSANRHIPANGQRMAGAHERYRDVNKQAPPVFIRPTTISGGGGGAVQGTSK